MNTTNMSAGSKILLILLGIVSCIAGIWLFMYPGLNEGTLGMTLGIMFIAYGVVSIVTYMGEGPYKSLFKGYLILGIIMIVFGCIMLWNIHWTMNFLGILMGIILLVGACFRIWFSTIAKGVGATAWWLILIVAILQVILALMFLFNPGASGVLLTMLVGAMFLSQGAMDISIGIFA